MPKNSLILSIPYVYIIPIQQEIAIIIGSKFACKAMKMMLDVKIVFKSKSILKEDL